MKYSFSYYLTLFVIKLKGVKKTFDTDPINYKKLRKEDIPVPTNKYFRQKNRTNTFKVSNTEVTEVHSGKGSKKLILFIHGGAFVYGPVKHHWDTVEKLSRRTGYNVWLCNYPKAPEHKISEISSNIDEVYKEALQHFDAENIIFMGDSVGGTLLITLTQRLIKSKNPLPARLFIICPVIDPSFKNPKIDLIDKTDPILSKKGVLSAKIMCAENGNLNDPLLSPMVGSVANFPDTVLFMAEKDITFADQQFFVTMLNNANVPNKVVVGEGMPHIWPLLPVMKEAGEALDKIIELLVNDFQN
ncbi:MAG: alpha/beta hydrolase [Flavobacterium sp.]|uniref:alpha/beta hydrolase n=1 Tax=Flavobacterium sp. TaxID=239 RepID=UPI002FCC53B8